MLGTYISDRIARQANYIVVIFVIATISGLSRQLPGVCRTLPVSRIEQCGRRSCLTVRSQTSGEGHGKMPYSSSRARPNLPPDPKTCGSSGLDRGEQCSELYISLLHAQNDRKTSPFELGIAEIWLSLIADLH